MLIYNPKQLEIKILNGIVEYPFFSTFVITKLGASLREMLS